jgi:cyanophycinase
LIVIIPTADPNLPPRIGSRGRPSEPEELRRYFESLGARHVIVLHTRDRKTANSEAFAGVLRSAKAAFLSGGQSLLLEAAYRGTLVERELRALLARGGVIGGDSAGAIAIGCLWLTWLPGPFGKRSDEFCVLPGVAVSPHASRARGFVVDDEVLKYLRTHAGIIGIDIDENTMVELRRGQAEVFGNGTARFLDPAKNPREAYLRLASGERHALAP